jgi:hypothetical protein
MSYHWSEKEPNKNQCSLERNWMKPVIRPEHSSEKSLKLLIQETTI